MDNVVRHMRSALSSKNQTYQRNKSLHAPHHTDRYSRSSARTRPTLSTNRRRQRSSLPRTWLAPTGTADHYGAHQCTQHFTTLTNEGVFCGNRSCTISNLSQRHVTRAASFLANPDPVTSVGCHAAALQDIQDTPRWMDHGGVTHPTKDATLPAHWHTSRKRGAIDTGLEALAATKSRRSSGGSTPWSANLLASWCSPPPHFHSGPGTMPCWSSSPWHSLLVPEIPYPFQHLPLQPHSFNVTLKLKLI